MAKLYSIVLLFFCASAVAEDTTNNLVDNNNWSIKGDVYTCTDCKWNGAGQSMNQNADIIWVYSDEQGTVSQTFDLTPYNDIGQIDYGMSSFGCNNTPGDGGFSCHQTSQPEYYDKITVELNYGGQLYTDTVTLDYNNFYVDYSFSAETTFDADSAILSFSSIDPAAYSQWYMAGATHSAFFNVTYNVVDLITTTPSLINPEPDFVVDVPQVSVDIPLQSIEIAPSQPEVISVIEVPMDSVGSAVPDITMPDAAPVIIEIAEIQDLDIAPVSVNPMEAPEPEIVVEMDLTESSPEPEMQAEMVEPEMQAEMVEPEMQTDLSEPEQQMEAKEPEPEPTQEAEAEAQESEEKSEPEPVSEPEQEQEMDVAKEPEPEQQEEKELSSEAKDNTKSNSAGNTLVVRINAADMDQVAANFDSVYNAQAQAVAIAVMTMTSQGYENLPRLQDVEFYEDKGLKDKKNFKDRIWGSIYRDDKLWSEMVDVQYEY